MLAGTTIVLLAFGTPLPLDEAYRIARARAEVSRSADARIAEAEINVDRAWSVLKPQLAASYAFTHVEPKPPSFPGFPNFNSDAIHAACDQSLTPDCVNALREALVDPAKLQHFDFFRANTSLVNATITWNLLNGRALPLIENAYDNVSLEKDRAKAAVLDLLLTVARAYYAAAAARQAVEIGARARERAERERALVEKQAEIGESPGTRLRMAKIAVAQAETEVRRAKNAHAQSLLQLRILLRLPDLEDIVPPPSPVRPEGDLEAIQRAALERREDYRAAATAVQIAERNESDVWWRFAPTLGLFAGYRWSNVPGISGQKEQWSVGLSANVLLYDGGVRYQDLKEAEQRIVLAKDTLDAMRTRLLGDVERTKLRLEGADMSAEKAADALALAKERSDIVRTQYEVGALRTYEVKEADDQVLDAELGIVQAELETSLAILELLRAVGLFAPP